MWGGLPASENFSLGLDHPSLTAPGIPPSTRDKLCSASRQPLPRCQCLWLESPSLSPCCRQAGSPRPGLRRRAGKAARGLEISVGRKECERRSRPLSPCPLWGSPFGLPDEGRIPFPGPWGCRVGGRHWQGVMLPEHFRMSKVLLCPHYHRVSERPRTKAGPIYPLGR